MTELVIQLSRKFQYLRLSKIFLFACILLLLFSDKTREILVHSSSDAFIAVSSFVGFVPADAAKIAILVMVDEPKGVYWGGSVAAPVFKNIGRETLRYLNVPSNDQRVYILDRA